MRSDVRQLDEMDCGPACLCMVAGHYGKKLTLAEARDLCGMTGSGTSFAGIASAAEALGMEARAVSISWEGFLSMARRPGNRRRIPPCIVWLDGSHFVVVRRLVCFAGRVFVFVSDPASGRMVYRGERFRRLFECGKNGEGYVMAFSAPENGVCPSRPPVTNTEGRKGIMTYAKPFRSKLLVALLAAAASCSLGFLFPELTGRMVDEGVTPGNLDVVRLMLWAQAAIVLGQTLCGFITGRLMLSSTVRMGIGLSCDFIAKLSHLPISFFDSRRMGDLMQRVSDNSRIQSYLTETVLSFLIAVGMFVIYGVILGLYGLRLLAVFLGGSILYVIWITLFLKARRNLDHQSFLEMSKSRSTLSELVYGMQEIKLCGCEKRKIAMWRRVQEKMLSISSAGLSISNVQQLGGTCIDQMKNIAVTVAAASSVVSGDMTIGGMMAVQFVLGQLNVPLSSFISFIRERQDARISMERIADVMDRPEEPSGAVLQNVYDAEAQGLSGGNSLDTSGVGTQVPFGQGAKLGAYGDISFSGVSFRYGEEGMPLALDDVNFIAQKGKVTALVGASGSGKSTAMKLMLGFYRPLSGSVRVGDCDIADLPPAQWRQACGCVMQDGYLFSDTIAGNIAPGDEAPDMDRVRSAAEVAMLSGWVESLPSGYRTFVGADGSGISMGQRQRILIARAVYKNSPYLFFDEATNSLDTVNERAIMERLSAFFKERTVIVVAHRLSTIRNADRIVVMDSGRVVGQGKYEELMESCPYFRSLVGAQI